MIGGRSAAAVWRQARRVTHYHVTEGRRDTRQATRPPTSAGGCGRGAARVTDLLMSLPRRGGGKKYKNVDGTVKCQHGGGRASQDYLEPFVILPALLFVCMCVCVCVCGACLSVKSFLRTSLSIILFLECVEAMQCSAANLFAAAGPQSRGTHEFLSPNSQDSKGVPGPRWA